METTWKNSINKQRVFLTQSLSRPLQTMAGACASVWDERKNLDAILLAGFPEISYCTYLYALDSAGIQISSNISKEGLLADYWGRNRAERPYMKEALPAEGFLLSDAYISLNAARPSLTALQVVKRDHQPLGFLGADFDLRDLPVSTQLYQESDHWRQIKGDPAIRRLVFQQHRVESLLDQNMEQVFSILEELLTQRGMFQGVIHFSSSRATVWVMDDPYRYRILDQEALNDTDICLAYPQCPYPDNAVIPKNMIEPILKTMQKLRMSDDTIYLRSSSINIFNGLISLTFSCDGTHYMPHQEFIAKDISFWDGS